MSDEPITPEDGAIGPRIRRYREERGLSLSQLAAESGISKGYLWTLENEDGHSRPSANTLHEIAEALGVLISDLLGRTLSHDIDDTDIPESLRLFAEKNGLPKADIRMLASVRFRGRRPESEQRWEHIYNSIRLSQQMDEE